MIPGQGTWTGTNAIPRKTRKNVFRERTERAFNAAFLPDGNLVTTGYHQLPLRQAGESVRKQWREHDLV
jgi:hypothetical protein